VLSKALYHFIVKKKAAVLRNLPRVKGMTEDERIQWGRWLAATPDERWRLNLAYVRSVGSLYGAAKKLRPFGYFADDYGPDFERIALESAMSEVRQKPER
jgi:hypothetical protein